MAYLLTTLEQIVLVRIIRAVWEMKPAIPREIQHISSRIG